MLTNRPTLPAELIDIIIDHLHSDVQALKACILTSKTWVPSCRYHLFQSIHLDLSLPAVRLRPFFDHLAQPSSHFPTTLRTLTLRCEYQQQTPHILTNLATLRALQTLSLSFWYTTLPNPEWFRLSSHSITRLGLTSCRIGLTEFIGLAQQLEALEALQLSSVSWKETNMNIESAALKAGPILPRLRELHLGRLSAAVLPGLTALLAHGVIVGKVNCVRLDELDRRNTRAAGALLRMLGTSLHSLTISAKTHLHGVDTAFTLEENTSLKSVHFGELVDPVHDVGLSREFSNSWEWVADLLHQLPCSVQRVAFSCWLVPGDRLGLDKKSADSVDWRRLVPVLARLERLKEVEFRLAAGLEHRRWLREKIGRQFKGCPSSVKVVELLEVGGSGLKYQ
ncbi:hypothetical protein H0H81_000230 [Sphagnurus paluster]|uniref:Uncharacterized protein n=1 Tax=Sphagnurus paluster TaxID=117069 RepID=A0A9P7KNE2_9AGAR|nr:hypothetical protein H0H81_000230 [Sphagnurus paluster]